jgi:hypothetical protein
MNAKSIVETFERDAALDEGAGERFSGYAIMGVPFQSAHVLALRRFSASSIGPAYTAVWHRNPSGAWTFYSTVAPDLSCARYFGAQVARNVVAPIDIEWVDSSRLRVVVGSAIEWHVALNTSFATWALSAIARAIPQRACRMTVILRVMSVAAKLMLNAGPLNFAGHTPNGHRFLANPMRVWLIESSDAIVDGVNVGPIGPLTPQASLGDLLLPQRGLFALGRSHFQRPPSPGRARMSLTLEHAGASKHRRVLKGRHP